MAGKKGMRDRIIHSPAMIEKWRAGVSASLIRKRLDQQALGTLEMTVKDPVTGEKKKVPYHMSKSELRAAELLLARCVPTLSSVEMTGKDGGPIESMVTFYMPKNGRD